FGVTLTVQYGLSHTPANQAIVIFLFELVVAAISSYFLAGELMTMQEWLGGAMIVAASLFSGKLEQQHDDH
ncbi:MAG: EamA family transporter, partial [Sulfurimicrobium sp.]|nr:EamA family transporter [Sulfurimicrobium sp.]